LADSRAKLFFQNESILILSENTTLDIAKFQMTPQGQRESALMKVLHGSLRFIVHKITAGVPPNFEIQGITAVMGICDTGCILWHPRLSLSTSSPLKVIVGKTGDRPPSRTLAGAHGSSPVPMHPVIQNRVCQHSGTYFKIDFSITLSAANGIGNLNNWIFRCAQNDISSA
jgi:hypothetical protein